MKFKILCNIFILFALFESLFLQTVFAANNQETSAYQRANVYYEQDNFDEAIKQYSSIQDSGLESGNLYYNLGNCYFKKGELGMAILYYEKARRLIPLDKDLEFNYEYASSLIKGQAVASQKSLPLRVADNLFEKFTVDGLTILLSALYILILVSILISFFFRTLKKHALIVAVFIGLAVITGVAGLTRKITLLDKEAIVITEQADAKFEPMDKATTYFTLYEGMKVEVISSKNNWHKVRRQDNKSGWVGNNAIAIF
jgi:tetratricopeptide (TPR) repeat protein